MPHHGPPLAGLHGGGQVVRAEHHCVAKLATHVLLSAGWSFGQNKIGKKLILNFKKKKKQKSLSTSRYSSETVLVTISGASI